MTGQHCEAVSENFLQQELVARTAYTPTTLDSQMKQHFVCFSNNVSEAPTEIPQTVYPAEMINQVSSVTQHVNSDFSQAVATDIMQCGDKAYCAQQHSEVVHCKVQQADDNLQELQGNHKIMSEIPYTTSNIYQSKESIRAIPQHDVQSVNEPLKVTQLSETCQNAHLAQENINIFQNTFNKRAIGSTKEQINAKLWIPDSRDADKHRPVTEKTRIPTTADILKRPISPEFTMFPDSKSNSLLKLVLRKSLGNYSPEDFEKMKATATQVHDENDDDEDSDTEEDGNDDEDSGSISYDSSLAGSSSVIFERYWMTDSDEAGYSGDNGSLQQHRKYHDSVSRNSSRSSASSLLPDSTCTSEDYTG
jgi:hypothetical protein